jgi:hypothetical protein
VIAIIVSETIALKPTTGPKLISDKMQVNIMDTQTARRGTSKSWTYVGYWSAFSRDIDKHVCALHVLTGASKCAHGTPPSLANAHSCRLAVAIWLMSADQKVRMTGTTMTTVPALLCVELKKITTKGVRLTSEVTCSTFPTQKINVIAMINARMAFVANAVNSEYGMVLEASFAFSASHKFSTCRRQYCQTYSCVRSCHIPRRHSKL